MVDLPKVMRSDQLWKQIVASEIEGTVREESGDAKDSKFIASHNMGTSNPEGLLQKGLHLKPTSQPKKTSLD